VVGLVGLGLELEEVVFEFLVECAGTGEFGCGRVEGLLQGLQALGEVLVRDAEDGKFVSELLVTGEEQLLE